MIRNLLYITSFLVGIGLLAGTDEVSLPNVQAKSNQSQLQSQLMRSGDVQSSDVNLKLDIRDMDDSLRTLLLLRPRSFKYREDMSKSFGFIAQELEAHYPELVSGKNGSKRINYALLTPVAIKGIQELYRDLEEARTEVTQLQKSNTEMRGQIQALRTLVCSSSSASTPPSPAYSALCLQTE